MTDGLWCVPLFSMKLVDQEQMGYGTRGTQHVLQPRRTNDVTTLFSTLHPRPIS